MPLAPIKSIWAFSSEDPEYPALNLLDVNFEKKWKTLANGEKLAYVILQLERPELITGLDVGNEHSAFIEIHVGKSEDSPVKFIQLVSTSLLMTPFESKKSLYGDRIRSFGKEKILQSDLSKWDLIKIICTQPFNKHIQYGLSFVKIRVKPSYNRVIRRKIISPEVLTLTTSTDSDAAAKNEKIQSLTEGKQLLVVPAASENTETYSNEKSEEKSEILEDSAIQEQEVKIELNDIDPVWDKKGNDLLKSQTNFKVLDSLEPKPINIPNNSTGSIEKALNAIEKAEQISKKILSEISNSSKDVSSDEKPMLKKSEIPTFHDQKIDAVTNPNEDLQENLSHKPFNKLLEGVVFVISGLQNPDFSEVRSKAEKMGAKYKADWQNDCTHLVCVFKGTPKYKLVKRNNGRIVTRSWIDTCYASRKRLPWRRFALDSDELKKADSEQEVTKMIPNATKSTTSYKFTENEKLSNNLNLLPKKSNLQTGIKVNQLRNKITKFLLPNDDSKYSLNKTIPMAENGPEKIKGFTNESIKAVSQQSNKVEVGNSQKSPQRLQRTNVEILDSNNVDAILFKKG